MKKLTALLLGTVISIAFTASDAFAASPADFAMKYLKSDDGRTGGYLGVSYNYGEIDDITANYLTGEGQAKSEWKLDDGEGGVVQFGFDFGKIRFDWRLGGLYTTVNSIDGARKDLNASDEAVVAYTTFNFDLDLYRFELVKQNFVNIAITPYVGAGIGYGGGWMTGKKFGISAVGEPAGHGKAYTYETGVLVDLTDWAGITLGYSHLDIALEGHNTSASGDVETDLVSLGVRFTY